MKFSPIRKRIFHKTSLYLKIFTLNSGISGTGIGPDDAQNIIFFNYFENIILYYKKIIINKNFDN